MKLTGAGIILKMNKDLVLLVHGRKSKKWGFPKGHSNPGDSLVETAVREMQEETGINILIGRYEPVIVLDKHKSTRCYFVCNLMHVNNNSLGALFTLKTNDINEIDDVRWVHRTEWLKFRRNQVNLDLWSWIRAPHRATYIPPRYTTYRPVPLKDYTLYRLIQAILSMELFPT